MIVIYINNSERHLEVAGLIKRGDRRNETLSRKPPIHGIHRERDPLCAQGLHWGRDLRRMATRRNKQ